MSWSLFVTPLHYLASPEGFAWAGEASISPDLPPGEIEVRPLPTVAQTLTAFQLAGCHGDPWYKVDGPDPLPRCPDRGLCTIQGGLDLGEVRLAAINDVEVRHLSDLVGSASFRKPNGVAALRAVVALTTVAGPQLVFDDSADRMFVVGESEEAEQLAALWPW